MSEYKVKCKYCNASPHILGPHHKKGCSRYRIKMQGMSSEGLEFDCYHCGVTPYTPGPHHNTNCPRYSSTMM